MNEIFLDQHLSPSLLPEVQAVMTRAMAEDFASPAAPSRKGQDVLAKINLHAKAIYDLLGAEKNDSFIFFSSGIEAMEKVFLPFLFEKKKVRILASAAEDSFLTYFLQHFQKGAILVEKLPITSNGSIDCDALKKALEIPADLITFSAASGLLGVIQPFEDILHICQENNVSVHLDVTYLLGKVPFSFSELNIDYLTFAGDVLGGPKGSGGLMIKEHRAAHPWITGGEKDAFLARKMDVPSFLGLAKACEIAQRRMDEVSLKGASLRSTFEIEIKKEIPEVEILLDASLRLPNVVVIAFPKILSELFLFQLNEKGLFASFGRGFAQHIAPILIQMSVDPSVAYSALSFSFSPETKEEEIQHAVDLIVKTYQEQKR